MGACYETEILLRVKPGMEPFLIEELCKGVFADTDTAWAETINHAKEGGADLSKATDWVRMVYGGWKAFNPTYTLHSEDHLQDGTYHYEAAFDASYGWEVVMVRTFERIAPYLEDGSWCYLEPDDEWEKYTVKNGVAVLTGCSD